MGRGSAAMFGCLNCKQGVGLEPRAVKQALERSQTNFQRKTGFPGREITSGADEGRGLRVETPRTCQRNVQIACRLCRREPFSPFTARLDQIEPNLAWVQIGKAVRGLSVGGEIRRRSGRAQSVPAIGRSARPARIRMSSQKRSMRRIVIEGKPWVPTALGEGDCRISQTLPGKGLRAILLPGPQLGAGVAKQRQNLAVAADGEER